MIQVKSFTFNSFEENSYILYDETKECVIIDPGCHLPAEEQELAQFIENEGLKPVQLLNTHCHIDHILGNAFVAQKYGLELYIHQEDEIVLKSSTAVASAYGIQFEESPGAAGFLGEEDKVKFGNSELEILFTPGHSPGSITFFSPNDKFIISGDVLFQMSIGRTDLPGGNYEVLMESIFKKLVPLGDDVKVYPGHMGTTTIGQEVASNPFLREHIEH